MKMLDELKECGFKDSVLLDGYMRKMAAKYPEEEVTGRRGCYAIPRINGALTTSDYIHEQIFDQATRKWIQNPNPGTLLYTPNVVFFDVMKVKSVGDCRLHMESVSTGASFQTTDPTADGIIGLLAAGYISGIWTIGKHGKNFYANWKGEPDEG